MAATNGDYLTPEPARKPTVESLPQETLDFAAKCFNLARAGGDEILKIYLDAGLPPNLTNSGGMLIDLSAQRPLYKTDVPDLLFGLHCIHNLACTTVYAHQETRF